MATRRVFISYARKDGTDAAHDLRDALRAAGSEVWLDTERIGGGASWSKEIETALNGCDVLVAVLTPASFISEICRAEQIWALDEGKVVIPVLAATGAPVPIHLKSRNWRKYPDEQAKLLADIATEFGTDTPMPRPLRYDTVPNLPQNHVVREKPLAQLRDLVFTEGAGANIAVTALAGMGGIGKTVLATALCRDRVVQRAFPDGIAWITIGREWDGDFVTRMREVARALGDDLSGYDNPLACENRYRTILREKAALVVVDDVWNLEHLKPLLVDAPRSRFLFTTRDTGIARAVTDRKYSANLLSEGEARDLLARWAGKAADALPPEAERIIQACGELALAVAQVGACLRDSSLDEWRDILHALENADVSAIEDRLPNGQQSFFKSLAVSFQALPAQMQERYLKLAILLEDVPAPLMALRTLWKADGPEARRTARHLVDRSLASWQDPAEPTAGIRLHDLQLDYVRARFDDVAALRLIHGALRLSANVIAQTPKQFASQIVGRLLPHTEIAAIAKFANDVAEGAPRPWLRPLWPSLHPPGTALIRTLPGHSDWVRGVAVTPDGCRAVSASEDYTLRVWDLKSGQVLWALVGHSDAVRGVAVTADRRFAVSACDDRTLKVWNLASGQEVRTLTGHSLGVTGVAVAADGRLAVSASSDNTLKLWNLERGQELRTLEGHSEPVRGVAMTADGRRAISASDDSTLKVWDLATGREMRTLEGHAGWVWGVAMTSDGRLAVSASSDNTLKVWNLETGGELRTLIGHSASVYGVAMTMDGRTAISASCDQTLKVWDLAAGQEMRTLVGHSGWVNGVGLTADGRHAVSASSDKTLKMWDLASSEQVHAFTSYLSPITGVAVAMDGRRAISSSDNNRLKVWDLQSRQVVRTLTGHSGRVYGVALTGDGQRAISASGDKTLKVWDVVSGKEVCTLTGHSGRVYGVAFSADGRRAVSASFGRGLKVWDLASGKEVCTLAGHSGRVYGLAVTADGDRAVSASEDKTLKVWDLVGGEEMFTLEGHSAWVNDVSLTADGRRAVSASGDNTLKVWDIERGRELRTLTGHTAAVVGVAITADQRLVVSASDDSTLNVWDLASGTLIAEFTCDAAAHCCAFAGSDQILSGDAAGRLHLLRLET